MASEILPYECVDIVYTHEFREILKLVKVDITKVSSLLNLLHKITIEQFWRDFTGAAR